MEITLESQTHPGWKVTVKESDSLTLKLSLSCSHENQEMIITNRNTENYGKIQTFHIWSLSKLIHAAGTVKGIPSTGGKWQERSPKPASWIRQHKWLLVQISYDFTILKWHLSTNSGNTLWDFWLMDKEDHDRWDGGQQQRKSSYTTQEVVILSLTDSLTEFIKHKHYRY